MKSNHGGSYRPTCGSKDHPHIRTSQRRPWIKAARRHFLGLLSRHDADALRFADECELFMQGLGPPRSQTIRNGTPLERATAIITNAHASILRHKHFPWNTKQMPKAMMLVLHALGTEVCIRYAGLRPTSRPRWHWVQVARSIHHMLKSDIRIYEVDTGRGYTRTVKVRHRLSLQSWNVAKRLTELLEPIYRLDLERHGQTIAALVLKAKAEGE